MKISAAASILAIGALAAIVVMPTASAQAAAVNEAGVQTAITQTTGYDGDVNFAMGDADVRLTHMTQAEINALFNMPASAVPHIYSAFVNAKASSSMPVTAKDLGAVTVYYGINWNNGTSRTETLGFQYLNGVFQKVVTVPDVPVGSLGFDTPDTDLRAAVADAAVWRQMNPGAIPANFTLNMAQLQKADAAPPVGGELRWVITYVNPTTGRAHQLLVSMTGQVTQGL